MIRIPGTRTASLAPIAILAALALHPQTAAAQAGTAQATIPPPAPQAEQVSPPAPTNPDTPKLVETQQRLGVFDIGGQSFTVLSHEKNISPSPPGNPAGTLSQLEVQDANSAVIYHEDFPVDVQDGHFTHRLFASASLFSGAGGSALMLRFIEEPPGGAAATESWKIFGLIKDKLAVFSPPLPLGQGSATVGGVLTGVMVRGGIGVVPLATTAELLEFRVWAGSFYVFAPLRINWPDGQWSEAEQCFALDSGNLRQNGCSLRINANPVRRFDGSTATLYAEPVEDPYAAQNVPVNANTSVDFLFARGVIRWSGSAERIQCRFDDLWLRVRIAGKEGWVHSAADFAALGLPAAPPPR